MNVKSARNVHLLQNGGENLAAEILTADDAVVERDLFWGGFGTYILLVSERDLLATNIFSISSDHFNIWP